MPLVIELRASARKNKNFAIADKIRDALAPIGVTLEDRAGATELAFCWLALRDGVRA